MDIFSRLLAMALVPLPVVVGTTEAQANRPAVPTLSVAELGTQYENLVGRRVKVEGFLLLDTGRPALAQGIARKSQISLAREAQTANHWCAFDAEPRPIAVHDLSSRSIVKVAKFARRKGVLVAQRVILEGTVGQSSDVTYKPAIYHPYEVVDNYEIAGLHAVNLVAVARVFCSGVLYKE